MLLPSRRTLLLAAGTVAGSSLLVAQAPAAQAVARPRPARRTFGARRPTPRVPVMPPTTTSTPGLIHLLRRTTYGLTPALVAEATALGPTAWLERQLAPTGIDDSACDAMLARYTHYFSDPPKMHADHDFGSWVGMRDTVAATLARAIWSRRQLLEVMVEFWSNHLNSTAPSSEVWSAKGFDDRTVIRPHALGRFSDMLVASAGSPAMLRYLDGAESRGSSPNENYGRELLELHTVGRDAGYGQAGVVAVARALTGRTTWTPWNGGVPANLGLLRYRADWHHVGPLSVLGWSHVNASATDGMAVGDSLLRHLAAHPETARRIAGKLCVRFISDTPPPALVERLAAVYLSGGTAIVPVLRALFSSPEFAGSAGLKYRRPYEDVVASLRALDIRPGPTGTKALFDLSWQLGQLGHAPFGWHPPDGYPDVAAAWTGTGTVLGRWNIHVALAQGWWKDGLTYPGTSLLVRLLPGPRPATRTDLVTATFARLMPGGTLPVPSREALVTFLGGAGPVRDSDVGIFPILVALLLDTPAWSVR